MPMLCCRQGCASRHEAPRRTRAVGTVLACLLLPFLVTTPHASDRVAAKDEDATLAQCELYPLGIGTQWIYQSGPLIIREKVVRHEMIHGEMCARIETFYEDRVVHDEHLAVRDDGIYRVAVSGKPIEPPFRFLALPARPGVKWTVDSRIGGQSLRGELEASEGSFTVRSPRGDQDNVFKTQRVTSEKFVASGSEVSMSYDFVAHVGKVKQTTRSAGQEMTLELKDILTPGQVPTRTVEGGSNLLRR